MEDIERRNQHVEHHLGLNMKYFKVFIGKYRNIKCKMRRGNDWVEIGGNVVARYLPS